ncbi:MAG: hypothetical protein ACTH2U_11135 [Brevibacterium sp.]
MEWTQIVIAVVGGGGLTGLLVKLNQLIQEHKKGELDKEDTAIARFERIADDWEETARYYKKDLDWYRVQYMLVREELTPEIRAKFEPEPPAL